MIRKIVRISCALAMMVSFGCTDIDPEAPSAVNTGSADFTRYVAIGNSTTAGTQSNGLVDKYQRVSYPALVAAAARVSEFEMPLISEPGIPPLIVVNAIVPALEIVELPGLGAPTNTTYPGIYNNLGIPGARIHELLVRRPLPGTNPFFEIVLRDSVFGPTAVDQAANMQPTFLTAWMGLNDVFGSASQGTDQALTSASSFETDFRTAVDALRAASEGMVVGNLPDILVIPFFTTIPPILVDPLTREPVLDPTGNLIPLIGEFQGGSGDLPLTSLLTLRASAELAQGKGIPVAYGGTGQPLPDFVVLDPTELGNITSRLGEFNAIIDSVSANRGIPVADVFGVLNEVKTNGFMLRDEVFTTDYISGGIFSVDGFHPSSLGYYIVALEFIRTINAAFGASIPDPPVRVEPALSTIRLARSGTVPPIRYAMSLAPDAWNGLWRSLGMPPVE